MMEEKQKDNEKTLDELLEDWQVESLDYDDMSGMYGEAAAEYLKGWYGVSNIKGYIAYFAKEEDAFRFRLAEINRILNG